MERRSERNHSLHYDALAWIWRWQVFLNLQLQPLRPNKSGFSKTLSISFHDCNCKWSKFFMTTPCSALKQHQLPPDWSAFNCDGKTPSLRSAPPTTTAANAAGEGGGGRSRSPLGPSPDTLSAGSLSGIRQQFDTTLQHFWLQCRSNCSRCQSPSRQSSHENELHKNRKMKLHKTDSIKNNLQRNF